MINYFIYQFIYNIFICIIYNNIRNIIFKYFKQREKLK